METIELRQKENISGAFSDIFIDRENDKVYKLFKNHNHKDVPGERGLREDQLRILTYRAEAEAFEIASKSPEILQYIPKYYGEALVSKVTDRAGNEISDRYLLDCCYSTEFINDEASKLNTTIEHIKKIIELFNKNDIMFLMDASAFYQENPDKIKIIDFAIYNAYCETEAKWIKNGIIE